MNIAYIFHGHTRSWKSCHQNFFKNVYSVIPGDIYIHTWDRINSKIGSHWNGWDLNESLENLYSQPIDIKELMSVYNPVHFLIEKDPGVEYLQAMYNFTGHPAHLALKNYLRGQQKIFNAIHELGKKYDKYFFVRFDIDFLEKMNEEELHSDKLVVPIVMGDAVFDIWKVGTFDQCKITTAYADAIDELWLKNFTPNIIYEGALTNYYLTNGIELQASNTPYEIRRIT